MKMENWKDIVGYEGYYQVSDMGNVRSVDRTITTSAGVKIKHKGKPKKQVLNGNGYLCVCLTKNCVGDRPTVHRLVAITFLKPRTGATHVNHIDGNPLNNKLSNLEFCTHKENINHAWRIGLCENTRMAGMKKVIDEATGLVYNSIRDAASLFGISEKSLSSYLTGYRHNKTTLKFYETN